MFIECPPLIFRQLFPEALFRIPGKEKCVYLTFDDGPIPEVTPWVLDVLDQYHVKATFFMVGDNVVRNPHLYQEVKRRGHCVGNHTMNHMQGSKVLTRTYLHNILLANEHIKSTLFRPPHGWLRFKQAKIIKRHFTIVMYDLITRDYSKRLTANDVYKNVCRYARNGSIIVFHDSLKSFPRLKEALPKSIEWLKQQGYQFKTLETFNNQNIE